MFEKLRPTVDFLKKDAIEAIIDEAMSVLEKTGVDVENDDALDLLAQAGVTTDTGRNRVKIKRDLVESSLKTVPSRIQVFDRKGTLAMDLKDRNPHFDPGSAAINILDPESGVIRKPVTTDLINFVTLTDALDNFAAQSTGLVPADVPGKIADRYRLFLGLQHCSKPVVTGTFAVEAFDVMKEMLVAVRGSESALREKPLAIFDCCPSPPLRWDNLTCQSLVDCARAGIPAEMVSMPLTGATAPITIVGALVQHTAENLSGIVIHQLAKAGAPIIHGGSPAYFDMRHGTTPMGAIETMMIDASYAQIGRHLGVPTHAYMGLSDSKLVDYQGGLETGMGAILAALTGVNVISGGGMLDFESCQSLEKLVVDNDICGMALRAVQGVEQREESLAVDLYGDVDAGDHFLMSDETMKWMRIEPYLPSDCIDRSNRDDWLAGGGKGTDQKAKDRVKAILDQHKPEPLPDDVVKTLRNIMESDAGKYGMEKLPF